MGVKDLLFTAYPSILPEYRFALCRYDFFKRKQNKIAVFVRQLARLLFPWLWLKAVCLRLIMTPVDPCDWLGLRTGWGPSREAEVLASRPDSRAVLPLTALWFLPGHIS